jgi:hypothetical protein
MVGEPMVHPFPAVPLTYSPDGRVLAVVSKDNAVRLWDSTTGLPLGPPLLHATEVLTVRFAADSRHLVTVCAAGAVRRWPLPDLVPDDPAVLELWVEAAAGRSRPIAQESALLNPDAWRQRCEELRKRWPQAEAALAGHRAPPAPADEAAYHDARARDASATGNTFALLWHLERLSILRPDDWRVQARRGSALAEAGDFAAAGAAFR